MSIYTISDLHLSFGSEKPMSVFGPLWEGHERRLEEAWRSLVQPEDVVVLPGDLSWAMTEAEVLPDLRFLHALPGQKVLLKGNHEFWWQTANKLGKLKEREGLSSLFFLHNDSLLLPQYGVAICGTRGWKCPGEGDLSAEDEKIIRRELLRLETSLQRGRKLLEPLGGGELLAFLHYPPFNGKKEGTLYTELLERYGVRHCFYGHLHGASQRYAVNGVLPASTLAEGPETPLSQSLKYRLVAADYLDFRPLKIV